jgi:WD40 repeat protein
MGASPLSTTAVEHAPFDLTWLQLVEGGSGGGESSIFIPGGSSKNVIQVTKAVDVKRGLEFSKAYDTEVRGKNLPCRGVISGFVSSEPVVCSLMDNACAILTAVKGNNGDVQLKKMSEFKADFSSGGMVTCACILPSGHMVTGGDDGVCRLWAINVSKKSSWSVKPLVQMEGHTGQILAVSFHPNDALVGTVAKDGTCRIWNVVSGKMVRDVPCVQGLSGSAPRGAPGNPKLEYKDCLFSTGGSYLFVIQSTDRGAIYLVEWRTTKVRTALQVTYSRRMRLHKYPSTGLKMSDGGGYLAIGNVDGTVTIVDVETFQQISTTQCHSVPVTGVAFAPDATAAQHNVQELVASCASDNKVVLIKVSKGILGRAVKGSGTLSIWLQLSTWLRVLVGLSNFRRGTVSAFVAMFLSFVGLSSITFVLLFIATSIYFST